MKEYLAVVMAGGVGERLRPLTDVRAKPAVPFGGIYRIIDFTLSNCINSTIRRIFVLTQYKSYSLHNHLNAGWAFLSRRLDQFIDEIPAQMQTGTGWYAGTADAIRQNMTFIEGAARQRVLILSGDHIYKMDYRQMGDFHAEHKASLTVAVVRVPVDRARGAYGVLEVDDQHRIVGFEEKPAEPKAIPDTDQCLASMGIYIFEYDALKRQLDNDLTDFGKDVIPQMIQQGEPVYAYDFSTRNTIEEVVYASRDGQRVKDTVARASDSDYWRDVGTLESYWAANLDLVAPVPRFNLYGEKWPVHNCPMYYPPAKFVHDAPGATGLAINSIVAAGAIVSGAVVRNSVLGPGIYLHRYAQVESSVLLGGAYIKGVNADTSIGRGCRVRNAIIDKSVRLNEGTDIGHDRGADEARGLKTQDIPGTGDYVVVVPWGTVF